MASEGFYAHFIVDNKHYGKRPINGVPRVGDEVRMGKHGHESFFVVKRVVWCMDEPHALGERVNIELVKA